MKTTALGLLAATGAATVALLTIGAPAAHADSQSAITQLHAHGFTNNEGDTAMLRVAYSVCTDIAGGDVDGLDEAYSIWLRTGIVSLANAKLFVLDSVNNLCPEFNHNGEANSNAAPAAPTPDFGPQKL